MSIIKSKESIYCNECGANVTNTLREEQDNNYYCLDCASEKGIELKTLSESIGDTRQHPMVSFLKITGIILIISGIILALLGSLLSLFFGFFIGILFIALSEIISLLSKIHEKISQ